MKVREQGQFEAAPAGSHLARCYAVIDLGSQPHSYQGESWTQRDVRISFELPTELMLGKYDEKAKGKPFSVHMSVKQSLHPKARLRAALKGWRGRDFTPEELKGFDLKNVLGKACRLNLVMSQDGQFTNIDSIAPLGKAEKCPKQVNASVYVSLDPDEFNAKMLDLVSDKTREKIMKSPEWQALMGGEQQPPHEGEGGESGEADDNVPF